MITITTDPHTDACYIRLSDAVVSETIEVSDDIFADLDEFGVVVGLEILGSDVPLPFDHLERVCHIHSSVLNVLRLIRPTVGAFMSVTSTPAGAVTNSNSADQRGKLTTA